MYIMFKWLVVDDLFHDEIPSQISKRLARPFTVHPGDAGVRTFDAAAWQVMSKFKHGMDLT